MTSADIAAIFKKGAVIDLTCDPNALIQSETSYYNKFTKEELLCKIFQRGHLQGAYKNMLRNPKSKIVDVFKRWQSNDIDVGKAYTELFI